jgi:cytochrome c-type biogenesis protein CcmH/NrfG
MTKPTQPTPEPTKPTRAEPDKYTRAARLARRLEQLRRDADAELLTTPQTIEARYEARRKALLADASPDVINCLPAGVLRAEEL